MRPSFARHNEDRTTKQRHRRTSRIEASGTTTEVVERREDWFAALADVFDLRLVDLDAGERERLWQLVRAQHEAWAAQQAG